jgi:cation diffusion facilitator family transporter
MPQAHEHNHQSHDYQGRSHSHIHNVAADPALLDSQRGIRAVLLSLLVLGLTAILQLAVVVVSGSVALLADTIHNFGDAATALPLWIAFRLGRRKPGGHFSYGYGRVEDLAGISVVLVILLSAASAAWEAVYRLLHPQKVDHLWAVALAALAGFVGNEAVAMLRIRAGKEIGSSALVADGYHARADGFTSLAVFAGVAGVWLGFPQADAAVGLFVSLLILRIVWHSGKEVFLRVLDGADPEIADEIRHAAGESEAVCHVSNVRVRWLGHRLRAEVNLAVDPALTVEEGHEIANNVRHNLLHQLRYLDDAVIHVDPEHASGEEHHKIIDHSHDDLPLHSH